MTTQPLVTIVTPSLNTGEYISETIESVLSQSYPRIEYKVLDGGSTDDTVSVLRSFGDRVQWEVAEDTGQSNAINRGWRAARGEVIAWLCADDLLEPDAVSTAVEALLARPDAAVAYGKATELHPGGLEFPSPRTWPFNLWWLIYSQDFIHQPAAFFRRDAVAAVGWLNESLHDGMDWDLFIRLGKRYPMIPIHQYLARVRVYPETKSAGGGRRRFHELVRIIRDHSGERRPPAYWYYGLEVYRNMADQTVERMIRQPVIRRRAHSLIHRLYERAVRRVMRPLAHEWMEDGWAGRSARFIVPAGAEARFEGEVPADLAPLPVLVASGGTTVTQAILDAGPFTLLVPLPQVPRGSTVPLTIIASRAKSVPHALVEHRAGSYRLTSVDVTDQ